MKLLFLVAFVFFSSIIINAHSKTLLINEKFIIKEIQKNAPTLEQIHSAFWSTNYQEKNALDKFQFQLNAQSSYFETSEKKISSLEFISTPVKSHTLGISKLFKTGMNLNLSAYVQQTSMPAILNKATSTGAAFNLSIDLYKDLFGRLTRAQLQSLEYGTKKAQYIRDVQEAAFIQEVRKLYWSLVANSESLKVSEQLLKTSIEQAKNARRRKRDSVADSGEVAKYESQVSSRKAYIVQLKYQKEMLVQKLKELLPTIGTYEIELAPYDLDQAVNNVLSCTENIKAQNKIPTHFTLYDEILEYSKKQYREEQKITKRYSDWDLKLDSEIKTIGKGIGYSKSFDAHQDNRGTSFQVAIQLTIPLGSDKKETKNVKKILDQKRFIAEQEEIVGKISAYHYQIIKLIDLLLEIIKNQKENSAKLADSLRVTKQKYNQARISVHNLINDQDTFLQSNLDEIQTKLTIVTTLLNYFSVFTQTACGLNQI